MSYRLNVLLSAKNLITSVYLSWFDLLYFIQTSSCILDETFSAIALVYNKSNLDASRIRIYDRPNCSWTLPLGYAAIQSVHLVRSLCIITGRG